jgi:serine/threonine protein kinase
MDSPDKVEIIIDRRQQSTIDLEAADEGISLQPLTPSESEMAQINRKLEGRYQLQEILGTGGVGTVYLASDLALKRQVAIKVIRSKFRVSPKIIDRFREEATIVASFAHPNIVQIHEIIDCDLTPLIVMEYVPGTNLEKLIRNKKPDRKRLIDIMISVCETVAHAHAHGVIHCDIKPENILLSDDGRVKIADFGVALRMNPNEEPNGKPTGRVIMGSPAFMSPEQARGDLTEITNRADIFGIGATLHYALTGRNVIHGTAQQILDKLRNGNVDPIPEDDPALPIDLRTICQKCLESDPEERYRSSYLLADDLRRFQERLPVSVRTYSLPEKMVRAIKYRKRNFFVALAVVLVVMAFFLTVQVIQYQISKDSLIRLLKDKVKGVAGTASLLVNPADVEAVHTPADRNTPACENLVRILNEVKARNSQINYAYIGRKADQPGYISFVALDTLARSSESPDLNRNGRIDPEEQTIQIGDVYQDTPKYPDMMEGFEKPTADRMINAHDQWNVGLSGYAPIRDTNGQAIAIFGVDIRLDELNETFQQIDRTFLASLNLSLLFSGILIILILRWRVAYWDRRAIAIAKENPLRLPYSG